MAVKQNITELEMTVRASVALLQKRIYDLKKQESIASLDQLAQRLSISKSTLTEYLRHWGDTTRHKPLLPRPENFAVLRRACLTITDEDAKIIQAGMKARRHLAALRHRKSHMSRTPPLRARGRQPVLNRALESNTAPPAQPVATTNNALPTKASVLQLFERLMEVLGTSIGEQLGSAIQAQLPLVTAPALPPTTAAAPNDPRALLLAHAERYQIGDMSAILTKDNVEAINISGWTEADQTQFLAYANLVLVEARKCLLLLAQFEPDQLREDLLRHLARNAGLLWRTYKVASSVAPIEYVQDIDLARQCGNID